MKHWIWSYLLGCLIIIMNSIGSPQFSFQSWLLQLTMDPYQFNSAVVATKLLYSAFAELLEAVFCFLDFPDIKESSILIE